MQLDIFEHSRDVMLRNDVVHALGRRDAPTALAACDRLAHDYPADASLTDLRLLADGLAAAAGGAFGEHLALRQARQAVEASVHRGRTCLRRRGGNKVVGCAVGELALRAEAQPFLADSAQDHSASLWLRAGNWEAAAKAVRTIESWRRIPARWPG